MLEGQRGILVGVISVLVVQGSALALSFEAARRTRQGEESEPWNFLSLEWIS